jgi:two-component system response regulator YesN
MHNVQRHATTTVLENAAVGSKRVLIVENDERLLQALQMTLAEAGHDVVGCLGFGDARRYLAGHSPDFLLTEIRLGAFNGLHLAHLVKSTHPNTSVLIISGYDDPVLRNEAAVCGADYRLKPVSSGEILEYLQDGPTAEA